MTSVIPDEYKIHRPLWDTSDSIEHYKADIHNKGAELYKHVILVCVLGNKIHYVEHWKTEISTFAMPVFNTLLKSKTKNIDRGEYVKSEMMAPFPGVNFEDFDEDHIKLALNSEIHKGEKILKNENQKSNWKKVRFELEVIKAVRANLDEVVEKCREPMKEFYDKFVAAASYCSINPDTAVDMFNKALEELQPVIE